MNLTKRIKSLFAKQPLPSTCGAANSASVRHGSISKNLA